MNNKLTDENRRFLYTLDQLDVLNTDINTIIAQYLNQNDINNVKKIRRKKIKLEFNKIDIQKVYHNTTLPYCGKIIKGNCFAMRKNRGLYTQCKNSQLKNGDYCSVCLESSKNSPTEKPTFGDIRERNELIEKNLIKVINFGNIVEKLQLNKNKCIETAKILGWEIPNDQREKKKTKRGRPKKKKIDVVMVEDSEEEYVVKEISDDDIISNLIADCV